MYIRPATYTDSRFCCDLAFKNWGVEPAQRCHDQLMASLRGMDYDLYKPVFCIADAGDPLSRDYVSQPVGFAAYQPSMKMKGSFDFIWIAVDPTYQGGGVGKTLTDWRIKRVKERGGQMIELVTQKPAYFSKFGFFKLHHLGNEWYLMLKLLKTVDI